MKAQTCLAMRERVKLDLAVPQSWTMQAGEAVLCTLQIRWGIHSPFADSEGDAFGLRKQFCVVFCMLFTKNVFYYWVKTQMSFCLPIWAQLLSLLMEMFRFLLKCLTAVAFQYSCNLCVGWGSCTYSLNGVQVDAQFQLVFTLRNFDL